MAYAEKRDGKLTGRWYGEERVRGQRFRKVFETKTAAEGYEAYVKATGEEPLIAGEVKRTGRTFREVADQCKARGGPGDGVWKDGRDHSIIQRLEFVCSVIGDIDIATVATPDLDRIVDHLSKRPGYRGKPLSNATINRYLTAASAILTYATERGLRTGKPVVPLLSERGSREEVLEPAQERAVLAWLRDHGHNDEATSVSVLVETGMRLGEFTKVGPEQIGNDWINLWGAQTKTNKARQVWIRPELAREYWVLVAEKRVPDTFQLLRKFKAAAAACGYSDKLVLHSLRHTRATRLLQAGTNPRLVMEMMGWTSLAMLQRYTHVNSEMHAEAAKKVAHELGHISLDAQVIPLASRIAS